MARIELKPSRCPNPVGTWVGLRVADRVPDYIKVRRGSGMIACNSWQCPFCGPRKRADYRRRYIERAAEYGGDVRFGQKFLTLTGPGGDWRRLPRKKQLDDLSKSYDKLMRALQKRLGKIAFLRVVERHKDGSPHYHVLMSGQAVVSKGLLNQIKKLWCDRYGMGFVKLVWIRSGLRAAISYIFKYITKDLQRYAGRRVVSQTKTKIRKEKDDYEKYYEVRIGELYGVEKRIEEIEYHGDMTSWVVPSMVENWIKKEWRAIKILSGGY